MQTARQQFLAGAAFAQQHHGSVAACHLLYGPAYPQHAGVTRHQAGQCIGLLHGLQASVLGLQLGQSKRALNRQVEQLRLEGFGKKIIGAQRDGAQGVGLVVLPRQHNHLGVRIGRKYLFEQAETFGHRVRVGRQPQVHGHHGRRMTPHLHQRALPVIGSHRFKAVQRPLDLFLERQIVFDDQQRTRFFNGHDAPSGCRSDSR